MSAECTRPMLERFAAEMAARLGLALDLDSGTAGVEAILAGRLRETACCGLTEYLARLDRAELGALAEQLTIGETYFFRYREQFDALGAALLAGRDRPLRILSAGCSSGEEAGTLAILISSLLPEEVARASSIVGVDVNPAAVRRAKRGRYSEWSLRETPTSIRVRWFRAHGRELELAPAARALVSFSEANLGDPLAEVWGSEASFDAVFCRNVLMYFAPDAAAAVVARMVRALVPGGLLFLGPTETHLGRVSGLSLESSHGAFYHRRVDGAAAAPAVMPVVVPLPSWVLAPIDPAPRAQLADPPTPAPSPAPPPVREPRREDRLAEAMLLADAGDMVGAERVGEAILAREPLLPEARHLIALCREHRGDLAGAVEHDRAAVYLDARFAMPHLHLGLMARRRGDAPEAARELRLAAALLADDDGERIQLFGGGLSRAALIDFCRAELRALTRITT